ncbi:MAG: HK97 family phage prohead protease [Methylocella sp.]
MKAVSIAEFGRIANTSDISDVSNQAACESFDPKQRLLVQTDGPIADLGIQNGRTISFVLSDESVARDNHTIATDGWVLDGFKANPTALWAHDTGAPPIGKVSNIRAAGSRLLGDIEFADAETFTFGDTIFKLLKRGFLNAVSVGWNPLEWRRSSDPNRPGGIDFLRQELLEVSVVPVPALKTALATARAGGIDTGPLFEWAEKMLDAGGFAVIARAELEALRKEARMPIAFKSRAADWKCGASRTLPLDEDSAWDGPAAEKSVFDACGFDGDKPDTGKARKAFLAYDAGAPKLKGSYKLPFAKMIDGRMTAAASGIRAAASRLPQTDIPAAVKETARAVLDAYEKKMKSLDKNSGDDRHAAKSKTRALWHCAWLASLLNDLGVLVDCTECEALRESDGGPVPADLAAAMKALGQRLIDMTAEEAAELLDGGDNEAMDLAAYAAATIHEKRPHAVRLLRGLDEDALCALAIAIRDHLNGSTAARAGGMETAFSRKGKTLSAATERCIRGVHDHVSKARAMIRGLLEDTEEGAPEDEPDAGEDPDTEDDPDAALRKRKAAAIRAQAELLIASN